MISSERVAASSRITRSAAGSRRSDIRTTTPRPWSWAAAWRAAATRSVGPAAGWIADRFDSSRNTRPEPRSGVWRRLARPPSALTATRSSDARPMYPSAAAARFAKTSFSGRPVAIDADVSMRIVIVTSSSSTKSLTKSFSRRA